MRSCLSRDAVSRTLFATCCMLTAHLPQLLLRQLLTSVQHPCAAGFLCKICDFGMSRLMDARKTHVSTNSFGTVNYQPPELLCGQGALLCLSSHCCLLLLPLQQPWHRRLLAPELLALLVDDVCHFLLAPAPSSASTGSLPCTFWQLCAMLLQTNGLCGPQSHGSSEPQPLPSQR